MIGEKIMSRMVTFLARRSLVFIRALNAPSIKRRATKVSASSAKNCSF
jgi:hypothetical protein